MTNFFKQMHNLLWQWAGNNRPCLYLAVLLVSVCACDTETVDFGSIDNVKDVVIDADQILTNSTSYNAYSHSILLDSVRSNSRTCYLGCVSDPETGAEIKAEYACQLHCFEGAIFPDKDSLVAKSADGSVMCDDVELLIFYNNWYGNRNLPLKVEVVPLDKEQSKLMPQGERFYTDIDLSKFALKNANGQDSVMATKVFSAWDRTLPNSDLTDNTHTHCARVSLPNTFGDWLMNKYYDNPQSFKDSYTFTREVCPGFYLKFAGGEGTMVGVTSTSLNVYYRFHYIQKDEAADTIKVDSIYSAYTNFVGTPEVVQATSFKNTGLQSLLDDTKCTYVKSPAGMATEIELPIDEIYKGHEADSLARVHLTMMCYNNTTSSSAESAKVFAPPTTLAMIVKSELKDFFEEGYELTSRKFSTATYSDSYGTYDFSNISRLVSYLYEQKSTGNPDWNKVVLVPVTVNTNSATNTVISVLHDMSLSSAKLVGGETPIKVNVTYSRYK